MQVVRDLRRAVAQSEGILSTGPSSYTRLVELTRTMMAVHERERIRVARELHDDICQRVTLLSLELRGIACSSADPQPALSNSLLGFCGQLDSLAADIQAISHGLHSRKVEILGLAVAADSLCRELATQHGVAIAFSHEGVPDNLQKAVAFGLFRVLQEALSNGIKHSRAQKLAVDIHCDSAEIRLEVSDAGAGFDTASASPGLGLITMRERLAIVNGELFIESRPGAGTIVTARVPLGPRNLSPLLT
jgi:signal transduction histidine kinase